MPGQACVHAHLEYWFWRSELNDRANHSVGPRFGVFDLREIQTRYFVEDKHLINAFSLIAGSMYLKLFDTSLNPNNAFPLWACSLKCMFTYSF